jgi:hypothetical protein
VLRNEDDVEKQTDICQAELDRVSRQTTPVCLERAVDEQLEHAQKATTEVEQLLCYGPPDGGLPFEICKDLRDVLPDCQD